MLISLNSGRLNSRRCSSGGEGAAYAPQGERHSGRDMPQSRGTARCKGKMLDLPPRQSGRPDAVFAQYHRWTQRCATLAWWSGRSCHPKPWMISRFTREGDTRSSATDQNSFGGALGSPRGALLGSPHMFVYQHVRPVRLIESPAGRRRNIPVPPLARPAGNVQLRTSPSLFKIHRKSQGRHGVWDGVVRGVRTSTRRGYSPEAEEWGWYGACHLCAPACLQPHPSARHR